MRPGDPHNRQYQPHKQNKLQRQREEYPASIANKDKILCRKSEDRELMREPLKANHLHVAEKKVVDGQPTASLMCDARRPEGPGEVLAGKDWRALETI